MTTKISEARQRIIEEAEHLIHLHGYRSTSLEDIAKRCKVTKANLFHHFKSKEDLGLAVLDYKIDCYRRCTIDRLFPEGADPEAAVDKMFLEAAQFHQSNGCKAGCFVGNIALEMSDVSSRFRERAAGFFEEWTVRLAGLIEKRGHTPQTARSRAQAIVSLYEGAIMLARAKRDAGVFDTVRPSAVALTNGLMHGVESGKRR